MIRTPTLRARALERVGRLLFMILVLASPSSPPLRAGAAPLRLRVFDLFQISQLLWSCPAPVPVEVLADGIPHFLRLIPGESLHVALRESSLQLTYVRDSASIEVVEASAKILIRCAVDSEPPEFLLSIPGKITRFFRGPLELSVMNGCLRSVLWIGTEQLVAEVVGAEMSGNSEAEALKAQAVAARSFIATHHGRHARQGYDFCDTTHCQFTRGSRLGSAQRDAAQSTRGMVLTYHGGLFPAFYSAVCSGRLSPLPSTPADKLAYPHRVIECPYCGPFQTRHPGRERIVSPDSGASNGHGVGLCQAGALEMARHGMSAAEILRHFFPYTELRLIQDIR